MVHAAVVAGTVWSRAIWRSFGILRWKRNVA
jgi:hypothetical protein